MTKERKRIDGLIRRTYFEVILLILCVVLSYFVFANNNLSASAQIAQEYATKENAVQVMVGHNTDDESSFEEKILDKAELTVRNPNKREKHIEINLIITNINGVNLDDIVIQFKDVFTEGKTAVLDKNTYKIIIYKDQIEAYDTIRDIVTVYTKNNQTTNLEYTFNVIESYYE